MMRPLAVVALLLAACTAENPNFDPISRSCAEHGFPSPTCDSYRMANGLPPIVRDMSVPPDMATPPDLAPAYDLWHPQGTCGGQCTRCVRDYDCCPLFTDDGGTTYGNNCWRGFCRPGNGYCE